ncbi:MAG: MBL fold metallo-hydrolase [Anaerolineae bacterium]|nr:MBL fold metallo-hydrolase [Anaerolineae bacterium]
MTPLAALIEDLRVPTGQLALAWLGGASFVLKAHAGPVVAIDPYLSDSLAHMYGWERLSFSPVPMAPAELRAGLVLTTHAHEDHLDPETIPDLARASDALIAGPASCVELMAQWGIGEDRVARMDTGDRKTLRGVDVAAVFAHHASNAGAQTPDAVGYVVELGGVRVYHTGDTLAHPELAAVRALRPDAVLICINGGYGNMGPEEAAHLTAEIDPAVVIPMHWGLVAENTSDPRDFVRALAATGSRARPLVMTPGDCIVSAFGRAPAL